MLTVIDIDGTVADSSHRQHFLEGEKKDWDSFLDPKEVSKDTLIPRAKKCIDSLADAGVEIVFLTGRNERLRKVTKKWLMDNLSFPASKNYLYMRPEGDHRPAAKFKDEMLGRFRQYRVEDGETRFMSPWLCIDDDPVNFGVYQKYGAIYMKAPECWANLFPEPESDLEKDAWRR